MLLKFLGYLGLFLKKLLLEHRESEVVTEELEGERRLSRGYEKLFIQKKGGDNNFVTTLCSNWKKRIALFCTQSDSSVFFRCHSCRKMT
ncbi:hypothetical protein CUN10_08610, partial [Enterococcus faecium]